MKNFLFNKYTAYNYLKSQKQVNDLLSNYKKYIDNKEYELIAKKIVKSIKAMKAFKASNAQFISANKGERNLHKFSNFDCTVINSSELLHES